MAAVNNMFGLLALFFCAFSVVQSSIAPLALPLPYAAVAPFASSYSASTVNHNIATPVAAAYTAPLHAAYAYPPAAYAGYPAPYVAFK